MQFIRSLPTQTYFSRIWKQLTTPNLLLGAVTVLLENSILSRFVFACFIGDLRGETINLVVAILTRSSMQKISHTSSECFPPKNMSTLRQPTDACHGKKKEANGACCTKLTKSANGACERQPNNLKGAHTGDGTLSSRSGSTLKKQGFQHVWRHFPPGATFLIPRPTRFLRTARRFADASVRVSRSMHPWSITFLPNAHFCNFLLPGGRGRWHSIFGVHSGVPSRLAS